MGREQTGLGQHLWEWYWSLSPNWNFLFLLGRETYTHISTSCLSEPEVKQFSFPYVETIITPAQCYSDGGGGEGNNHPVHLMVSCSLKASPLRDRRRRKQKCNLQDHTPSGEWRDSFATYQRCCWGLESPGECCGALPRLSEAWNEWKYDCDSFLWQNWKLNFQLVEVSWVRWG